jgi:hypothetical protein
MATSKTENKESVRTFRSADGEDIRVTHPDGSVAIVGEEPRELPRKLWRHAIKQGCLPDEQIKKADLPLEPKDDAFTRKQAIKDKIVEAMESDENDEKYDDAFTSAGVPNVRWLEKQVGFGLSAQERDEAWAEVQSEREQDEDEEEEEGTGE